MEAAARKLHDDGLRLAAEGRMAEAAVLLARCIEEGGDGDATAHNNLGNVLADLSKLPEAKKHYERALEIRPTFVEAHRNLAATLSEMGETQAAIDEYMEVIKLKEDADVHYNVGNLYSDAGDIPSAERHYRRSLAIKPSMHAHNNLGLLLHTRGQVHAAASHYLEAIALDPNSQDAKCNLGVSLRALGDTAAALQRLEEAVMIDPDCHKAHFQLGMIKQAMSLLPSAAEHLQLAVKLAPNVHMYRIALVLVLRALHKQEEAKDCLKPVMASLAKMTIASDAKAATSGRDLGMLLLLSAKRSDAARVLARLPPPPHPHPDPGPFTTAAMMMCRLPSRGGEVAHSSVHAWVQMQRRNVRAHLSRACVVRAAMDQQAVEDAIAQVVKECEENGEAVQEPRVWYRVPEGLGDGTETVAVGLDPLELAADITSARGYLLQPEIVPPLLVDGFRATARAFLLVTLHHGCFVFSEGVVMLAATAYAPASTEPTAHLTSIKKQKDSSFNFFASQRLLSASVGPDRWATAIKCIATVAANIAPLLRTPDVSVSSLQGQSEGGSSAAEEDVVWLQLLSLEFALRDDGSAVFWDVSETAVCDRAAHTPEVWKMCVGPLVASVPAALCGVGVEDAPSRAQKMGGGGGEWVMPEHPCWLQL